MNYQYWLSMAASRFVNSDSPKPDAEILLSFVTGRARTFLLAFSETELTGEQLVKLAPLVERRQQGEPIAYLVGEREFWSLPLTVSSASLIPRPDTESLVEQALVCLPADACRILDLGSGSGAIALALASERPDCLVIGIDINADAVTLARHNALKLSINNLRFFQGNWFNINAFTKQGVERDHFSSFMASFRLIVSNPPYIASDDPHLKMGDVRYEPVEALVAGDDGMDDLVIIVGQAPAYLLSEGWLLVEHGWQQAKKVQALFYEAGFSAVMTHQDYGGRDRFTLGQWK